MSEPRQGYVIVGGQREAGRLRALWAHRGVLWSFTLRELQVRYRQAALGFAWALLQPLTLTLVAALIVQRVVQVETGGVPYSIFVFTALVPWTFLQTALLGAVPSLVSNSNLVRKIWFPREALPLATVLAVGLDLILAFGVWIGWLVIGGHHVGMALLWSPVLLGILVLFTAALALLGAGLNARFRDVKHALPVLLQACLFASPVLYGAGAIPGAWREVYAMNPLVGVIEGLRATGLSGHAPDPTLTGIGAAVSLLSFTFAYWLYTRLDRHFADVV